jgi:peptide/nickel transport system permease protein
MNAIIRNPGISTTIAAVAFFVIGGFAGVPLIWLLMGSMALVVLGAVLVNGTYVLRRLMVVIPTLVIITAFTFWLENGRGNRHDLAFNILGPGATDSSVGQIVKEFHLDQPLWRRYLLWLSGAVHGDLGKSAIQGQQVSTTIAKALPVTLQLMLYAQIVALVLAIPAGVYASYRANKRGDRIASTAALGFFSIPNFVLAVVLILFLALGGVGFHGHQLGWKVLPAARYVPFGESPANHFRSMLLPTIALGLGLAAGYMRVLRSDMIATLQENFITTAKAKGVPDRRILFAHALRPSSFTLLTIVGLNSATLIGGALIIETIFTLPGLGTAFVTAIFQKDFLVVQGITVVIAVSFILINFLTDILYAALDPRVRHVRA